MGSDGKTSGKWPANQSAAPWKARWRKWMTRSMAPLPPVLDHQRVPPGAALIELSGVDFRV
jgi:hypothetical protein